MSPSRCRLRTWTGGVVKLHRERDQVGGHRHRDGPNGAREVTCFFGVFFEGVAVNEGERRPVPGGGR